MSRLRGARVALNRDRSRTLGFLNPHASSYTLAWLARHRGRLHTLLIGGKRLSVMVVWDSEGATNPPEPSSNELTAIRILVYGDPADN